MNYSAEMLYYMAQDRALELQREAERARRLEALPSYRLRLARQLQALAERLEPELRYGGKRVLR